MSITNTRAIPGTDDYWRQRQEAFALIRTLERAIKTRNQAPMYIGSSDDPAENTGPWDRVCKLQGQARQNMMAVETLTAQKRLAMLTA